MMDREAEQREMQNLAAAGYEAFGANIFQTAFQLYKLFNTNEDGRKHEQTLLALAQEFAATKERILSQLPDLHNQIDQTRKLAQKALAEAEANAQRDGDKRMVFRDKDGNARYEDGSLVPTDVAEKITWREGVTPWEDYKKLKDILEKLDAYDLELVTIEDDIHRMGDDATPENVERLREHDERIKHIKDDVNNASHFLDSTNRADEKLSVSVNNFTVPEISPS